MPSLSTPEDEPSISSHIIPVHAYVSAPDVQPTYQEILAEIKGRKKSGSRPPMDPTRQGAGPQRMKQRRNRIKRRTATPVAAIDKQDNLAMADSGEGPSSSSTEGSRKPSTSAPMELPDIQPFALRNVPPTTTANPDALQKGLAYSLFYTMQHTTGNLFQYFLCMFVRASTTAPRHCTASMAFSRSLVQEGMVQEEDGQRPTYKSSQDCREL
ncbi:hypothetical protein RvY_12570-2 [Ramazzottius varieornatus]|uniref:Uncharacterized protein n=1 Tax=Ramazzottius varieornatus TaxID=947166 RepID=A0A1D1VK01_RAMVA|nr:hypothetical protein RvY_12570-2 [Ramazzottius varieornatus]